MKKILVALAIVLGLVAFGVVVTQHSAGATGGDDGECVPQDPWTETIPGQWWNFSPNKEHRPFEGPPTFPSDPRGTWQGPHTNGGPQPDAEGVYKNGGGHGSWFYRVQPKVIEHPGKECPDDPIPVTPVDVSVTPATCEDDGSLVVPAQKEGVQTWPEPGTYGPGTYNVEFSAEDGFVLTQEIPMKTYVVESKLTGEECDEEEPPVEEPPTEEPPAEEPPADNPPTSEEQRCTSTKCVRIVKDGNGHVIERDVIEYGGEVREEGL